MAANTNVHGHGDGHTNHTQLHRRRLADETDYSVSDETDWYGMQRASGWLATAATHARRGYCRAGTRTCARAHTYVHGLLTSNRHYHL